jgi:hypothetical protein
MIVWSKQRRSHLQYLNGYIWDVCYEINRTIHNVAIDNQTNQSS